MLRLLAFCLVLLVAVVAVWLGLVALSPSYNRCIQNNGQHSTEQYTSNGQEIVEGPIDNPTGLRLFLVCGSYFANRNGEAFTGLFTIALTIATFLLGYMARLQYQTSHAQLRPYVFCTPKSVESWALNAPLRIYTVLENTGETPAQEVEWWGCMSVETIPLMPRKAFGQAPPNVPHSRAVVHKRSNNNDTCELPANELPQHFLDAIREGLLGIYIYSNVTYRDVLGHKWQSESCLHIHPENAASMIDRIRARKTIQNEEVMFTLATEFNEMR